MRLNNHFNNLIAGSGSSGIDGDHVAGDEHDDIVDQQFVAAGRLHEGDRRLDQPLRDLRLPGLARVCARQLCREVSFML